MPLHTPAPGAIVVVTGEDDRFAAARQRATELASERRRRLILYDWDAASIWSEPLPTWWSSDGWDHRYPDRLDPDELETVGRPELAAQVRGARAAGLDAFGWLPSDHGPGALAAYAAGQGAATIVIPRDLQELGPLESVLNGTAHPIDELEARATAELVIA